GVLRPPDRGGPGGASGVEVPGESTHEPRELLLPRPWPDGPAAGAPPAGTDPATSGPTHPAALERGLFHGRGAVLAGDAGLRTAAPARAVADRDSRHGHQRGGIVPRTAGCLWRLVVSHGGPAVSPTVLPRACGRLRDRSEGAGARSVPAPQPLSRRIPQPRRWRCRVRPDPVPQRLHLLRPDRRRRRPGPVRPRGEPGWVPDDRPRGAARSADD